ncbi:MAG TPA: hypothetical protein VFH78_13505 [Candidatus Thermoplasmatota archaeon]|nr:hypothetical protein [Candidatus Thermoplasmatota archaeon]
MRTHHPRLTSYVLLLLLLPPVADAFTAPVVRPPDLGIPEAGKGATLLNVRVAQTPAWYAGQAYLLSLDEVAFPAGAAFEVVRHPAADEEDAAARAPEGSVPVFYPAGAAGHEASRACGEGASAPCRMTCCVPNAREASWPAAPAG